MFYFLNRRRRHEDYGDSLENYLDYFYIPKIRVLSKINEFETLSKHYDYTVDDVIYILKELMHG